jgi:hypothetical protein
MLLLHLLNRMNSTAQTSEQREFLLDLQQPFLPLPVSNMRLRILSPFTSIPLVQFLKLCDFGPKPGNLFAKYLEMLHPLRIAFIKIQRRTASSSPIGTRLVGQGFSHGAKQLRAGHPPSPGAILCTGDGEFHRSC